MMFLPIWPLMFNANNLRLDKQMLGKFDGILAQLLTLVFQLEDTVRLFGPLLLLDPIQFPKSEPCLLIGSVCQNGALLGASL